MPFTSYAQNYEDVMLWRALGHIEKGLYVDVGAQDPVIDSVSKAFYERGWRGIHVEPVQYYADLIRQDRPDETVLQLALSDTEGTLELNMIPDTGLSTGIDGYAERHQIERGHSVQKISVPVTTLKAALSSLAGKPVHWLKIDVEGLETQVLKGWDSQALRPWIMVLEATIPNSAETDYAGWEPILLAADYQFVYFDGLNRFYVAKEHPELVAAFSTPPNVFDDILLTVHSPICRDIFVANRTKVDALNAELKRLEETVETLQAQVRQVEKRADQAESLLNGMLISRSWKLTRPLRWLGQRVNAIKAPVKDKISE